MTRVAMVTTTTTFFEGPSCVLVPVLLVAVLRPQSKLPMGTMKYGRVLTPKSIGSTFAPQSHSGAVARRVEKKRKRKREARIRRTPVVTLLY